MRALLSLDSRLILSRLPVLLAGSLSMYMLFLLTGSMEKGTAYQIITTLFCSSYVLRVTIRDQQGSLCWLFSLPLCPRTYAYEKLLIWIIGLVSGLLLSSAIPSAISGRMIILSERIDLLLISIGYASLSVPLTIGLGTRGSSYLFIALVGLGTAIGSLLLVLQVLIPFETLFIYLQVGSVLSAIVSLFSLVPVTTLRSRKLWYNT